MGGAFCRIENNEIYNINNKQNLSGAEIGGIKLHAAIDTIIRKKLKRKPLEEIMKKISSDGNRWDDGNINAGTQVFDDKFMEFEEWNTYFEGYCGMGSPDSDRYYMPLPIWSKGNVYLNGARHWKKEEDYNGDDIIFDTDYFDVYRKLDTIPGPFANVETFTSVLSK